MANESPALTPLLTVRDVADLLGVAPITIYLKVEREGLPHYRISDNRRSRIRFSREQVEAWLVSRQRGTVENGAA